MTCFCVCVCVRDPELVNLTCGNGSKPRSANALLQCGFPEGLDQGIFLGCTVILYPDYRTPHLVISCIQLGITSVFLKLTGLLPVIWFIGNLLLVGDLRGAHEGGVNPVVNPSPGVAKIQQCTLYDVW